MSRFVARLRVYTANATVSSGCELLAACVPTSHQSLHVALQAATEVASVRATPSAVGRLLNALRLPGGNIVSQIATLLASRLALTPVTLLSGLGQVSHGWLSSVPGKLAELNRTGSALVDAVARHDIPVVCLSIDTLLRTCGQVRAYHTIPYHTLPYLTTPYHTISCVVF
jgi:hypothetical protein